MKINLHIEHLILEDMDLDVHGRERLGQSVRQQLVVGLAQQGLPSGRPALASQRSLNGGTVSLADSDGPVLAGQKIARAICRGIGNGDRTHTAAKEHLKGR